MAAAGNDTCELEIYPVRQRCRYSVPTSATVLEVKRRIMADTGLDGWRLNLYVLPRGMKMENSQTLATYQIRAGESRSLFVDIAKISVAAAFVDYQNLSYPIRCYEWESVMELKMVIVWELWKQAGVRDVGPEDMELSFNGAKLADLGAPLTCYGVKHGSWIEIKTSRQIVGLGRGPTSGL